MSPEQKKEYLKKVFKEANVEEQEKLLRRIEALTNETEKKILKGRYCEGKKWVYICDEIGYAWAQTHRLHRKAIEHLDISK